MQFIILGRVPGTDIQFGFDAIAGVVAVITVIYLIHLLSKEERYLRQKQLLDYISKTSI